MLYEIEYNGDLRAYEVSVSSDNEDFGVAYLPQDNPRASPLPIKRMYIPASLVRELAELYKESI